MRYYHIFQQFSRHLY